MTRINVYTYPAADEDPTYGEQPTVAGWFDPDKATAIEEDTDWDGNNHISVATGSKWEHEILYRTAKGRWVLHHWSQWQGSMPTYRFASDNEARDWLIKNGRDAEVEEYFGALDEEAGPDRGGRPEIGPAIQIRLGELLAPVDERAAAESVSRAEMVRRLVATGLAVPATRTLADVMPPATPLYRGQVERWELETDASHDALMTYIRDAGARGLVPSQGGRLGYTLVSEDRAPLDAIRRSLEEAGCRVYLERE